MKVNTLKLITYGVLMIAALGSCTGEKSRKLVSLNLLSNQVEPLCQTTKLASGLPRTITKTGEIEWTRRHFDWTEGFFPGTCWYLFEHTKDKKWLRYAEDFQERFVEHRFLTSNHDLGFVFNCSYGNAYRITGNESYKKILIDAANSLITRYNTTVGCIQSWDVDRGWQARRDWQFPVIIDNMMNLELLFNVSELTGDKKYRKIAISHANTTLQNHFRLENSSFHVIDYDSITGEVRKRETAQGFSHESAWARGQAWGLYGFTVCYRYTKDKRYLEQAEKIAQFILQHQNLPKDHVPYWDFDASDIPDEPRDASAAAIIASALLELDQYSSSNYNEEARKILISLSGAEYRSEQDTNHNFILKHSVGSIPHNNEIDVPLNYADYYFVEALTRLDK